LNEKEYLFDRPLYSYNNDMKRPDTVNFCWAVKDVVANASLTSTIGFVDISERRSEKSEVCRRQLNIPFYTNNGFHGDRIF